MCPVFITGSGGPEKTPSQSRCQRSMAGPLIKVKQGPRYKPRNFQGADKACWIIAGALGDTIYRNDFIDGLTLVIHFTFHVLGAGFVAVIGW